MTTEEKVARIRSIDIAEEVQMVVIWSCFSTEDQKEAAVRELDKLRAERREIEATPVEPDVIENASMEVFCVTRGLLRKVYLDRHEGNYRIRVHLYVAGKYAGTVWHMYYSGKDALAHFNQLRGREAV